MLPLFCLHGACVQIKKTRNKKMDNTEILLERVITNATNVSNTDEKYFLGWDTKLPLLVDEEKFCIVFPHLLFRRTEDAGIQLDWLNALNPKIIAEAARSVKFSKPISDFFVSHTEKAFSESNLSRVILHSGLSRAEIAEKYPFLNEKINDEHFEISRQIDFVLQSFDWSSARFARELGVTNSYLSSVKVGRFAPSKKLLVKILEYSCIAEEENRKHLYFLKQLEENPKICLPCKAEIIGMINNFRGN